MLKSSHWQLHWQLFTAIFPLFASDIPWSSVGSSEADRIAVQNTGALLKEHINEIPLHINQDLVYPDDVLDKLIEQLEFLLQVLEGLTSQTILDEDIFLAKTSTLDINLKKTYPRLIALGLSIKDSGLSITDHSRFLCLGQTRVAFRASRFSVETFIKEVGRILPNRISVAKGQSPKTAAKSTQFSTSFWECSNALFSALEHHLAPCTAKSSKHKALLHLKNCPDPGQNDHQVELGMLLRTCPDQANWQEVHGAIPNPQVGLSAAPESPVGLISNICEVAKNAYKCQQLVKICVRGTQLQDKSNFDDEPAHPEAGPTISLSFLLEKGLLKNRYTFPDVHKRILALTLAQSLLQLYEGPWIQTDWASKNLLFMYENTCKKVYNIHQPYLSCFLSSETGYQSDIRDPKHNYPLILSFGRLLMEMEKGESISITKEIKKRPSLYQTLKSHFDEWRNEQLTLHYGEAINGCLKFPQWIKAHRLDHRGDDEETACRKVILEKIVYPLELEVRNFQQTALGLRDLDLKNKASLPAEEQPMRQSLPKKSATIGRPMLKDNSRNTVSGLGRGRGAMTNNSKASPLLTQGSRQRPPSVPPQPSGFLGRPPNPYDSRTIAMRPSHAAAYSTATKISQQSSHLLDAQPTSRSPSRSLAKRPARNSLIDVSANCRSEAKPGFTISQGIVIFSDFSFDPPDLKKQLAKQFLTSFESFRTSYIRRVKQGSRVKIAVLDTGLKDTDMYIRGLKRTIRINARKSERGGYKDPIREKRNFTQDSDVDDNGHGTRVVGLLLTIAPEADLYVGKISSDKQVAIKDQKIAAALRWAIDEVDADIISMSFGLNSDSDWDDEMEDAITDAYRKKKVVFAAASNYGGNRQRTYPAKAETVFCIHATDGNGNQSEVDPTPLANCDNFGTLGVAVPCGFSDDKYVFKTGTSYSTPIAAGIAANIMDLVDWLHGEEEFTSSQRNRLRSYEGMKSVFRLMAPQQRQGYDYVAPWNLWNGKADESTIWGKIKEGL